MTRYDVLCFHDTPQEDVVRGLSDLYRSRGFLPPGPAGAVQRDELRAFEVSPLRSRWCVAFPVQEGSHGDDARHLSRVLDCQVLAMRVDVERPLAVTLLARGEVACQYPGPGAEAIVTLGKTAEGKAEATRLLAGTPGWREGKTLGDALGIEGVGDWELMNDALLDQEEAGYRHLTFRKPAPFGLLHRVRSMFRKPDLSARGPAA